MSIETILDQIKNNIETRSIIEDRYLVSKGTENGFELLVKDILEEIQESFSFDFSYTVHFGHHFPDISICIDSQNYGLELKSVKNGTWRVNGNSVFESISSEDYVDIFLLFGSKVRHEKKLKVKYAPYWQAVSNIKVTHSPRFFVDLTRVESKPNTLFHSREDYQNLQRSTESEKIDYIQQKLVEITTGNKWYISQEEPASVSFFNELSKPSQENIRRECFLLFPADLLLNKNANYNHATRYVLESHFVIHSSFRDTFTAGGKTLFCSAYDSPRILSHFEESAPLISAFFEDFTEDYATLALNHWKRQAEQYALNLTISNFDIETYKKILKLISENSAHREKINHSTIESFDDLIF